MGLFSFLKDITSGSSQNIVLTAEEEQQLTEQLALRRFAIECAVGLIAKTVSMAQFNFLKDGEIVRNEDWYRWNYEPNPSQNKEQFIYDLVRQLLLGGEAVVIRRINGMFVADSFQSEITGFGEKVFFDIEKDGFTLDGKFQPQSVYYFTYQDRKLRKYLEETVMLYARLLSVAEKKYKKSGTEKGILKLQTGVGGALNENQEKKDDSLGQALAKFLNSETSSVITLRKGKEYEELGKYHTQQSAEDIPLLSKEVFMRSSEAFHIPLPLLLQSGEATATKDNIDQFLNFGSGPILNIIETEGTRREIGFYGIKKGLAFKVDDSNCKRIDALDFAEAVDKLIASGAFCIDEVRTMFRHSPLNTEWSKRHYITSNYKPIELSGKEDLNNGNNNEGGGNQEPDGGRSGNAEN